jgi:hypothetical protein
MGVFAAWQPKYATVGIATYPVDPDKKCPKVSRYHEVRLGLSTAFASKFEDCDGIAFSCGADNGITILDIDVPDEGLLREALKRHGDTPLIERTASGKFHAWYKHNGERRSIKKLWGKDAPIDLLGGGMAIVAPTMRSDGTVYEFIRGCLADVPNLPIMRGLDAVPPGQPRAPATPAPGENVVRQGERNNTLFRACLQQAIQAEDVHQLTEFAMSTNAQFDPPLSDAEAMGCALSAWQLHSRGRNFYQRKGLSLPADVVDFLDKDPDGGDAMRLLYRIERAHWDRDQFCLAQAFAKHLGWTPPVTGRRAML